MVHMMWFDMRAYHMVHMPSSHVNSEPFDIIIIRHLLDDKYQSLTSHNFGSYDGRYDMVHIVHMI